MDIYKHTSFDVACERLHLVGESLTSAVVARGKGGVSIPAHPKGNPRNPSVVAFAQP